MRLPHVEIKMITRVREIETGIWTDSNKIQNVQNASRSEEARSVADIWWHERSEPRSNFCRNLLFRKFQTKQKPRNRPNDVTRQKHWMHSIYI